MAHLDPCRCFTSLMVKKLSVSNQNFLCPNLAFNLPLNGILPIQARKKFSFPSLVAH